MGNPKTPTNPKGGGRIRGKAYTHLQQYPGLTWEIRLSYLRMKAQAKFRGEDWDLSWEAYQKLWEGLWHLRGTFKGCLTLGRKDWSQGWTEANCEILTREQHWRKQNTARIGKKYPRKPKDVD